MMKYTLGKEQPVELGHYIENKEIDWKIRESWTGLGRKAVITLIFQVHKPNYFKGLNQVIKRCH